MNLDRITVNIRPRTPYEAVDLGFILARKWYWRLLRLNLIVLASTLLVLLPLSWMLPGPVSKWLFVLFWLCKPASEPVLLSWLSTAVFGEQRPAWDVLSDFRKTLSPGRILVLSFCRFSPYRSFALPVIQLEGMTGKERRQRVQLLADGSGVPVTLLIACFFAELAVMMSLVTFLFWLIPEDLRWVDFDTFIFTPDSWILTIGYIMSCALITPFSTSSGFMLYLSRRVELEAWDLEIGFKRIRQRLGKVLSVKKHTGAILLCLITTIISFSPTCRAASPEPEAAKAVITEVMNKKEFGEEVTKYHWVPKIKEKVEVKNPWQDFINQILEFFSDFVEKLQLFLAVYGEILLWICIFMIFGYLLLRYVGIRNWIGGYSPRKSKKRKTPASMFGLDLSPESLPDDLPTTCRSLLEQGKQRQAVSLLYRGTLSMLVNRYQLRIEASYTENECCASVRKYRPQSEYSFFNELTSLWKMLAYGHQRLDDATCLSLINGYQKLFGEQS